MAGMTDFESNVTGRLKEIVSLLSGSEDTTSDHGSSNNGGSNDNKAAKKLDELLWKNKELLKVKDDIRKLDESRNELENKIKEKLKDGLEVTKEEIDTLKRINKEREKKRIKQEQLEY